MVAAFESAGSSSSDLELFSESGDEYYPDESDCNDVEQGEESKNCTSGNDSDSCTSENDDDDTPSLTVNQNGPKNHNAAWSSVTSNFVPRLVPSHPCSPELHPTLSRSSRVLEIFFKLFPYGLFALICGFTNKRLEIYNRKMKKRIAATDPDELIALIGCFLGMSCNRLPSINDYWSSHCSLGNPIMKKAFSRDRFKILMPQLYLNEPEKPSTAKKTYYVEELVSGLKSTFQKYRKDSAYQSIDECLKSSKEDVRSSSIFL